MAIYFLSPNIDRERKDGLQIASELKLWQPSEPSFGINDYITGAHIPIIIECTNIQAYILKEYLPYCILSDCLLLPANVYLGMF
jgi:hypothetical protein